MKKIDFETVGSFVIGILTYLFGGFDSILITLLILIVIDYISGVCKAIYQKKLSSKIGLKGIIKKLGYLFIVMVATLFDNAITDGNMAIRAIVIYFFIANEAISILENWASLNLPLPKKLYSVFEKMKEENKN